MAIPRITNVEIENVGHRERYEPHSRRSPRNCLLHQRSLCIPVMSTLAQTNLAWSANVEVCFQPRDVA
jgi:hypothetical protein